MLKVMIVEDDPMVLDINARFLMKLEGFKLVHGASSIADARDYISAHSVDLILLDLYLPKESGLEFLKWLRKDEILTDVILITADRSSAMIQEAFRYGIVDYLIKPFTFERFKEALVKYGERVQFINQQETIDQAQLDKYLTKGPDAEPEGTEGAYTKGINKYTYQMVWREVITNGPDFATAEEISESSGVARVTVRRYLEFMVEEGLVEKDVEYGKIGRPQHKYRKAPVK
ncbi:MAG: response regulator [Clostridiaceae bacterium]